MASAAASAVVVSDGSGISEYEQFRLDNIRRNEEMLRSLGISVALVTSAASGRMAPNCLSLSASLSLSLSVSHCLSLSLSLSSHDAASPRGAAARPSRR